MTAKEFLQQAYIAHNEVEMKLEELERNKESSELLVATNNRIQTLNDQLGELYKEIKENYTFRLLDEMWILMGFEPIAEEFRELVGTLDKEQRRMECEFQRELGAKKMAAKMQEDSTCSQYSRRKHHARDAS